MLRMREQNVNKKWPQNDGRQDARGSENTINATKLVHRCYNCDELHMTTKCTRHDRRKNGIDGTMMAGKPLHWGEMWPEQNGRPKYTGAECSWCRDPSHPRSYATRPKTVYHSVNNVSVGTSTQALNALINHKSSKTIYKKIPKPNSQTCRQNCENTTIPQQKRHKHNAGTQRKRLER